jgi:hypothetical protein
MLNQKSKTIIISLITLLPNLVLAFPGTISGVISMFIGFGLQLIPLLGAIALLVFILGVAKFIRSSGNEKEIKDSKNLLIWGLIGIFVLMSVWGIVAFLRSEFGFGDALGIPQIKF